MDWTAWAFPCPSGDTSAVPWGPRWRDFCHMMNSPDAPLTIWGRIIQGCPAASYISLIQPQPLTKSSGPRVGCRWLQNNWTFLNLSQENKAIDLCGCWRRTETAIVESAEWSRLSHPFSSGNLFQDSQGMPEIMDSTEPFIYYVFSSHIYLW